MSDLKIVCWKWKPVPGYRSQYSHEQVNVFANMVRRHYPDPHEIVCITDDPTGIDPGVRIIPLWDTYRNIPSPHGGVNPACYHRLQMYAPEARDIIGERFVSVDLDCVIMGDMRPVWNRKEDYMIWGETLRTTPYNGSMQMMTAGARRQIWDDFDPVESPKTTVKAGYHGSDQAWISYKLGPPTRRSGRARTASSRSVLTSAGTVARCRKGRGSFSSRGTLILGPTRPCRLPLGSRTTGNEQRHP